MSKENPFVIERRVTPGSSFQFAVTCQNSSAEKEPDVDVSAAACENNEENFVRINGSGSGIYDVPADLVSFIYRKGCLNGRRRKRSIAEPEFPFYLNIFGRSPSNETINVSGELRSPIVEKEPDGDDLSAGAIAGIIVGCVAFVAIIIGIAVYVFFCLRRKGRIGRSELSEPVLHEERGLPYAGALTASIGAYGVDTRLSPRRPEPVDMTAASDRGDVYGIASASKGPSLIPRAVTKPDDDIYDLLSL